MVAAVVVGSLGPARDFGHTGDYLQAGGKCPRTKRRVRGNPGRRAKTTPRGTGRAWGRVGRVKSRTCAPHPLPARLVGAFAGSSWCSG